MGPEAFIFLGVSVPIISIVSKNALKAYGMFLDAEKSRHDKSSPALERRIQELEGRVQTLQEIVIAGDYEIRQRIERKLNAEEMSAPAASGSYAQTVPAATSTARPTEYQG